MKVNKSLSVILLIFIGACTFEKEETEPKLVNIEDPHSYSNSNEVIIKHLDWNAEISFENNKIYATASYNISRKEGKASEIVMDIKDIAISEITGQNGVLEWEVGESDRYLGSPLTILLKEETKVVNITYSTSENAEALQWLDPAQTSGGSEPFLFTQSQAILARSWIPIQDSPGVRFTYNAKVKAPSGLLALMSAENPVESNPEGVYEFKMSQPIPAYLMALAVGNIEFSSVGDRTGVYSEPELLNASAYEFGALEEMLSATEKLYGPYRWERYDIIVLPPSFPFGGMENPRLTFATPTVLTGDRSLTSLAAHELAHSWSGNLVTNATWNDFWLNEGFTVYLEYRIMEALFGKEYSEMLASLSKQELKKEIDRLIQEGKSEDTKLKLDLRGRNPDEGMTSIAYYKGYFFLRFLEERTGRERFDRFLRTYFDAHAFQVMTTEAFVTYLDANLISANEDINLEEVNEWIYEAGLPSTMPDPRSDKFAKVEAVIDQWKNGTPIDKALSLEESKSWSTHEWLHFLRNLPINLDQEQMESLDDNMQFTYSSNSEILAAWMVHAIRNQYEPAYENLKGFLISVGRRKFLTPLYKELVKTEEGRKRALEIYKEARPNYHYVSRNTIDEIVGWDTQVQ